MESQVSMTSDAQVYIEDVQPGTRIPELVKNCSPRQLVMWAAASGDFYQIHYDVDYAHSLGLPGLVVHGALKNAFLGQLLHTIGWLLSAGSSATDAHTGAWTIREKTSAVEGP